MSSAMAVSSVVDRSRHLLHSECARAMRGGHFTVRIRIIRSAGEPVEAWFFFQGIDGWQRQPWRYSDRKLVRALTESLDILVAMGHGDEWLVRRHTVSDEYDTDIQFLPNKFAGGLGANLDSVLDRMLFRESDDSKELSAVRFALHHRQLGENHPATSATHAGELPLLIGCFA